MNGLVQKKKTSFRESRAGILCRYAFCAGIVGISAMSPVTIAQVSDDDTSDAIENIFVIGERRAYQGAFDPQEVPAVDQIVDAEMLREVGALNLNDALDLSASVARQNNFGGLWNAFAIRGFYGDINLPSGFLVNGFNAGRGFGGPRDLIGIESVEVLKGPRSALFGRGEPGGTINLVTKRPQFDTGGNVRATIGSWQQLRFEGDYQSVAGADEDFAFRLVGFYEDAESFRDTVETQRIGFYPSATWKISEDTRLNYELEYTQQEIPFDRGVAFSDQFGFTPHETFVGEPGDGPIDTEVVGHQLELQHNLSDNWSLLAGVGFRATSLEGSASETNFGSRQSYFIDGQTISRFFRFRDYDSDYSVLRAELAGEFETGSLRHRLLFGADYDEFDTSYFLLRYRPGGIPAGAAVSDLDAEAYLLLDVFNPVYGQYPQPVPGPNTIRDEILDSFGFYVQDQIDITDRLQVRIGFRFDDFSQELINFRADPVSTTSFSDDRISPQFGAVYRVSDGLSVYASYGEGFRQNTGPDFEGNQFEPNITESAEVGVKVDLQHYFDNVHGSVTATIFDVDQSNILVNDDRPQAQAVGFFSRAAGEARSRGFEFDAALETDDGFGLWFSYAFIDAEFTNSNPDSDFGAPIEVGDPLINVPEHQLSIQASKRFEISGRAAQVGAGVQYTDERLGWTAFDFFLPSYTTARIFGQIEVSEGFTVRLDVDNLFDEEFYTNSYANVWVEPAAPQRFRLSADFQF